MRQRSAAPHSPLLQSSNAGLLCVVRPGRSFQNETVARPGIGISAHPPNGIEVLTEELILTVDQVCRYMQPDNLADHQIGTARALPQFENLVNAAFHRCFTVSTRGTCTLMESAFETPAATNSSSSGPYSAAV